MPVITQRGADLGSPCHARVVHRCVFVLLAACGGREPMTIRSTQACDPTGYARVVAATTAAELKAALADARPADMIRVTGTLSGDFVVANAGTKQAPIALCGDAVLAGPSLEHGYTLHITADWWLISGLTITGGAKGVMLDHASQVVLRELEVHHTGNEGIHFRAGSSDDVLERSNVHDTGTRGDPHIGEGVYVGSAYEHWCDTSKCEPDRCDRIRIVGNHLGPNTTAENLDIKEGTSDGLVEDNWFDGTGMVVPAGADSWVDVKGNGWKLVGNHGVHAPVDGFQTHVQQPGWGQRAVFRGNRIAVGGRGYGFRIAAGSHDTVVACDNDVRDAGKGASNIRCAP